MSAPPADECAALRAENRRLIALLEAHGIDWRPTAQRAPASAATAAPPALGPAEKVALFRRLFRGRDDVYPVRWESQTSGKTGYAPACGNEWRPGVCDKPRIKCGDCRHRQLIPLSDAAIYGHLSGKHTLGVYPLLRDETCHFLAVDFDAAEWRADALAFVGSCHEWQIPVALEISRSGNGAHAWIFFADRVPARDARRLGAALISHTCSRTRQLQLSSYDRLFPNQDTLPKGGFGNLIALPLQKRPREQGYSVFVDDALQPHTDQWAFLAALQPLPPEAIEPAIRRGTGAAHPLDVNFLADADPAEPWHPPAPASQPLPGPLPASLSITLANQIYFEKAQLPQPLANRLIRLAAFQNPEFYRAQALRLSVWNKPRVIGCAENHPRHIALPRGCLDAVLALLESHGIDRRLQDERYAGKPIDIRFNGVLRGDQEAAVAAMLTHDTGVLCAPTAFGKTVAAVAIMVERGVNTLILVHRTELLKQWQARLASFIDGGEAVLGAIGGGKARPGGQIDIALMQSLSRQGEVNPLVENYGQIIVDECHHVGAVSFDAILKRARAKFVLGLTATPLRRDGQHPIIFMQCGPLRHTAGKPASAPHDLAVVAWSRHGPIDFPPTAGIQGVFRHLAHDAERTAAIVSAVEQAYAEGRKVLVLTERMDHLEALQAALLRSLPASCVLHGRLSRKERASRIEALDALPPDAPRVLLATGKLVGEGFDHPPLDTLVLALPVSWKGTLQQYAGRLHREQAGKTDVRIIDFVDIGHPALRRMWEKRQRGYRSMGYRIVEQNSTSPNGTAIWDMLTRLPD